MKELEKVLKDLKGVCNPRGEQQYELTSTHRSVSLVAYVAAEDGLVGHQ